MVCTVCASATDNSSLCTCRTYSSDPALQAESVKKLNQYDFLHVLPGHGRRAHFANRQEQEEQMRLCLAVSSV